MKSIPILCALPLLLLVSSCLSRGDVPEVHYFRPELGEPQIGEAKEQWPLRFSPVTGSNEIGNRMMWRVSATELVPDEGNLWARRPEELLDERLRDLLFGGGGFRSSQRQGDPRLDIRLVTFEGDLHDGTHASVELIATLIIASQAEYRTRVSVSEPLPARSAEGLALAMGAALSLAAERTEAWVRSHH